MIRSLTIAGAIGLGIAYVITLILRQVLQGIMSSSTQFTTFVIAFSGITLIVAIIIERRQRPIRQWRAGRCAKCGYDMRYTPRRCPECGSAPFEE